MSSRVFRYCFTYRGNINPKMLKLLLASLAVNALVYSIPVEESVIAERIYGGKDTDISHVPYQVLLYMFDVPGCGGFIISPTHIVTTAECIHIVEEPYYKIRAGSSSSRSGGVTVKAKKFYTHPKFNPRNGDYDVGVVELATPLKLDDKTMKAIKLATKEPSVGSLGLVSGWGAIDKDEKPVDIIQSVELPVMDRAKCQEIYNHHNITVNSRMLCTYDSTKSVDIGDDGGPLVYKDEVVGLVSLRFAWSSERLPTIFTNVVHPEIAKFIKDTAKV